MTETPAEALVPDEDAPTKHAVYDTAELRFVGDATDDEAKAKDTAAEMNKLAGERAKKLKTAHKRGRYEVRSV